MVTYTQITRRKNVDTTETLKKHSDGSTLPYSAPTTMLSGITFDTTWDLLLSHPDQPF
jgi:hypothetical protein